MNRDWRDRRLQRKLRIERSSKYRANRARKWRATEHQRKGYVVYNPDSLSGLRPDDKSRLKTPAKRRAAKIGEEG